jgi:hypothetical protein
VSVPSWYELVLLGLAAYRTWKLIAEDTITEGLRKRWLGRRAKWGVFVNCPWCAGFWVSLAWWGAWQAWPHGTLVAATVFTLSLIVGVLGWAIS